MRIKTALFFHPACALHDPGPQRGIAPLRMELTLQALKAVPELSFQSAEAASQTDLRRVHVQNHIDAVLAPLPDGEEKAFDFETFAMSKTAEAALYASGQALAAVEAVLRGDVQRAFCVVSPGGHHAEADCALGFCFFNHIGLAALKALALGAKRVAVLDFDAHHGNGTQSLFWNHEERLYVSLHEENPLSGFADEPGAWDNILNLPLSSGSGGAAFRAAFEDKALPKIKAFAPDLLLVSAGFDMHKDDPLASLALETEDYDWIGQKLGAFADEVCRGRLVGVMEGGYNLDVLPACVVDFVKGLTLC